jgi:hypothetical protein
MRPTKQTVQHQIAGVAASMLAGQIGLREGCREIFKLHGRLPEPDNRDDDLMTMIAVDDELETVPMGAVRELWAPEALAQREQRAAKYLDLMREHILRSCQALIAKWGPAA